MVPAATEEVAGPACASAGLAYALSNLFQIHLCVRGASARWNLLVCTGSVMADEAIHIACLAKIKR
jgi:hypothetical protein